MDQLFSRADVAPHRLAPPPPRGARTRTSSPTIAELLGAAERPVLVLGSDVWTDGAEEAARGFAETAGCRSSPTAWAAASCRAGHPLLVTRARRSAFAQADLVVVVGTPLDFRLGYGSFGGKDGAPPAKVVHLADAPASWPRTPTSPAVGPGDLSLVLDGLRDGLGTARPPSRLRTPWVAELRARRPPRPSPATPACWPPTPTRSTRPASTASCVPRLADDAVVIGDGGDFVSYAGKYVEPGTPGNWLDPGPYGCLGTGLGYAIAARLARPVRAGRAAARRRRRGFSLMDVDTLVRHRLPVVMVVRQQRHLGAGEAPDAVALRLRRRRRARGRRRRYDEVVRALGGAGEPVTEPGEIGPALRPRLRLRRAVPGERLTDPPSPIPGRPPVSEPIRRPSACGGPTGAGGRGRPVGDLTVRAYVDGGGLDPDADYVKTLRRAGDRAAAAPMYVAVRDGVLVGAVSLSPTAATGLTSPSHVSSSCGCSSSSQAPRGTGVADALISSAVEAWPASEATSGSCCRSSTTTRRPPPLRPARVRAGPEPRLATGTRGQPADLHLAGLIPLSCRGTGRAGWG